MTSPVNLQTTIKMFCACLNQTEWLTEFLFIKVSISFIYLNSMFFVIYYVQMCYQWYKQLYVNVLLITAVVISMCDFMLDMV